MFHRPLRNRPHIAAAAAVRESCRVMPSSHDVIASHPTGKSAHWRRRMRRELIGLLLLKFAALALLWGLFFSPAHRSVVDARATDERLGMVHATVTPARAGAGGVASGRDQ
jgi:hypothetical protein